MAKVEKTVDLRPLDEREEKPATLKEQKQKSLLYQRDKYRQKVRGIFKFYEVPGGKMEFAYRMFKGDPIEKYSLHDEQICELPLGVAKHLNKNGWYPVHSYSMDESGKHSMKVGTKVRRFGFQSLEFVDIEDLAPAPQIYTAEHI